jgi:hypothetical protein
VRRALAGGLGAAGAEGDGGDAVQHTEVGHGRLVDNLVSQLPTPCLLNEGQDAKVGGHQRWAERDGAIWGLCNG